MYQHVVRPSSPLSHLNSASGTRGNSGLWARTPQPFLIHRCRRDTCCRPNRHAAGATIAAAHPACRHEPLRYQAHLASPMPFAHRVGAGGRLIDGALANEPLKPYGLVDLPVQRERIGLPNKQPSDTSPLPTVAAVRRCVKGSPVSRACSSCRFARSTLRLLETRRRMITVRTNEHVESSNV